MKLGKIALPIMAAVCAGALAFGSASAQNYPTKQVEVVVPYAAGGGTDLVARAFAEVANRHVSHPFGVVNKTGGAGAVGLSEIATARPNGYKIGIGTVELTMLPHMGMASFTADDFAPIALLNAEPSAISVQADSPWKTYEEFMAYAKENPGKVRVGNSGTGAIWHIAAAALEEKTGVKFNHVPYDGANPAVTALLGGHIEAVTVSPPEVIAHVNAGKIRILAVMAEERASLVPDVPTLKEKGVDLAVETWRGLTAPKATPEDIQKALREIVKTTAEDPAFKEALSKMNVSYAYRDAPGFKEVIDRDNAFFKDIMTKLGIAK